MIESRHSVFRLLKKISGAPFVFIKSGFQNWSLLLGQVSRMPPARINSSSISKCVSVSTVVQEHTLESHVFENKHSKPWCGN